MKATRGLNLKAKIRRDAAILVLIKARRWIRHMRIRFKAYRLGFFLDFFFGPNFCIARGGRPPAKPCSLTSLGLASSLAASPKGMLC